MTPPILFHIGPVEVTGTVLYSVISSGVLIAVALLVRQGLLRRPSGWPVAAELLVEHFEDLMRDMFGCDPRPYTPLVVTLALFIAAANLIGLVPGLHSPTVDFSTTAALAIVVFLAVPYYGIRAKGLRGYLGHYLQPTPRRIHRYLPASELLAGLVDEYAFISLYLIAAESFASEQASRLVAMDSSTRNTEQMLDTLIDLERRERQAEITREVLDLIGARFADGFS